ncbi:Enoyl-CoA hydratase/carnithine racemase [Cognatiyoonia sediminum]|uniref:Enoyl-CoA hydratase/carnithine racemase n=1 Tax=Cognatiyoonia sediminum TaxID=1508389 RepID=A0A1M5RBB8_9RHOB|nr:enoyl-CoA hydratase/isomerase family protein [Cognatiyoonia sediminum]SHH23595.1 Enoyl-CoA hydratase/carnithine racemase [Cognatiyoonia sediminum]
MIKQEIEGNLTILTLDRPDKANALTADMLAALRDAVRAASDQNALILTGVGKVFSAGADLEAAKAGLATSPLWEELSAAIAEYRGLSIAALNGTVAGGAFGMVLTCDLRIAVPSAKFFYPVMKLGFLPQPSDPVRLRMLVGSQSAKRILMAGEKLTAQEALDINLVDHLVECDVVAKAKDLACDALAAKHSHVAAIKAMI